MENLKNRIIARGEHSDHCHVMVGNCTITREGDDIFINPEDSTAVLRHLLESRFLDGENVWSKEHNDSSLDTDMVRQGDVLLKKQEDGRYKYIPQLEYDPFEAIIKKVRD